MKTEQKIDSKTINTVLDILKEEIVPAEGCTEPIALAFAAAKAVEVLGERPDKILVFSSGNIIKNVKSVIVPNSGGMAGIETSVAMGAIAGKPEKELLVISDVSEEELKDVKQFVSENRIQVKHQTGDIKLYIQIIVFAGENSASVEIKHTHTNITQIEKNGEVILKQACNDADFNSPLTDREILNIRLIYDLALTIDLDLIKDLFRKVVKLNSAIAEEGLTNKYGVNIGRCIIDNIEKGIYGDDRRNRAASYAAAGSDARMSGCPLPVMTTSGSGNQGMTASLPLVMYCQMRNFTEEKMLRALFFSHLTTIHVKTNIGRLSAHCGVVCASSGVAGGIALLNHGDYESVSDAIINVLGNVSGMFCDGAKASCAMKIATCIYGAFDAATLGYFHNALHSGDGIIGKDVEATIKNIGEISHLGMDKTDEVILDIMTK